MTDYAYDVFISYRREKLWTPWTREHFRDLLCSYLQQDLGITPRVFVDETLENDIGTDWVDDLGQHLATSKVLLAIFSADYFSSDWCVHELDLMHERMTHYSAKHLIIPVVVHDGEMIPDEISRLQPAQFSDHRLAGIQPNTTEYQSFSKSMRALSPKVAKGVQNAPSFNSDWIKACQKRFNEVFDSKGKSRISPSTITLKAPIPARVPRPIP